MATLFLAFLIYAWYLGLVWSVVMLLIAFTNRWAPGTERIRAWQFALGGFALVVMGAAFLWLDALNFAVFAWVAAIIFSAGVIIAIIETVGGSWRRGLREVSLFVAAPMACYPVLYLVFKVLRS